MKKVLKVLSLVLVFALVMAPIVTLAAAPQGISVGGSNKVAGQNVLSKGFSTAATTIQFVGYGIAIVMVIWLGIQWLLAQPAKKAELKGKMWSMAIGIILIVAGSSIVGALWGVGETVDANMQGNNATQTQGN